MGILKKLLFLIIFLILVSAVNADTYDCSTNKICGKTISTNSVLNIDCDCLSTQGPTINAGITLDCQGNTLAGDSGSLVMTLSTSGAILENCELSCASGATCISISTNDIDFINSSLTDAGGGALILQSGGVITHYNYIDLQVNYSSDGSPVSTKPVRAFNSTSNDYSTNTDANGFHRFLVKTKTEGGSTENNETYIINATDGTYTNETRLAITSQTTVQLDLIDVAAPSTDNYPSITLINPGNTTTETSEIINFTANVTDDYNVTTCSLYTNFSGWAINDTQTVNVNESLINFTLNVSDQANGVYLWNIECTDNNSQTNQSLSNFTFTLNIPIPDDLPNVTANGPANNTLFLSGSNVDFNITNTDDNLISRCDLYLNGSSPAGQTNAPNPYEPTLAGLTPGKYEWYARCNDSVNQFTQSKTLYFNIGELNITTITPASNLNVSNNEAFSYQVNISCTGYCGDVNASLDPYIPEPTTSFWQKILNFFKSITGQAVGALVPEDTGNPFYTTDNNPNTINSCLLGMDNNDCTITWNVISNGSVNDPRTFFAYVNSTNDELNDLTSSITVTIQNTAPNITLSVPINGTTLTVGSITFQADVSDDYMVDACSLYSNISNMWAETSPQSVNATSKTITFVENINVVNDYGWYINCTDNNSAITISETRILNTKAVVVTPPGGGGGGGDDDDEEEDLCDGVTCNDGDECTSDSCSEGSCNYNTIPNCPDLCAGVTCNDNDDCTSDSCDEGNCQHQTLPNCEEECIGDDCDDDETCTGPNCGNTCPSGDCGSTNTNFFCNETEQLCDDFIDDLMDNTNLTITKNVTYNNLTNQTEVQLAFVAEENLTNLEFYQSIPKCMAYYVHLVKFQNTDFEIIKDDPLIVWHFDSVTQGQTIDLSFEVLGQIPEECHELLKELYFEQQQIEQFSPSYKLAGIITAIIITTSLLLFAISKVDPKKFIHSHKNSKQKIHDIDNQVNKLMREVEK